MPRSTPLLDRIAARRSAQGKHQTPVNPVKDVRDPAPTVLPEWRRRMNEQGLPAKELRWAA